MRPFILTSFVVFTLSLSSDFLAADEQGYRYVGSGSCSAAACHGGTTPEKNQFTIWSTKDRHSRAYSTLFSERSRLMAKILKLSSPAQEDASCLSCHAMPATEMKRGPKYDINDGVSCESCHGAASGWLVPHTEVNGSYRRSVGLGMVPNQNLVVRAENCLSCHAGVSHQLLAAGHPDVVFELDTFSALMPKHWEEKEIYAGAKAWAVGQVVSLRDAMKIMRQRIATSHRLDEADMNCFQCHHNIYDVTWTPSIEGTGKPTWNPSRYLTIRHLLKKLLPAEEEAIGKDAGTLSMAFSTTTKETSLSTVTEAAERIETALEKILPVIHGMTWSDDVIHSLIEDISGDAEIPGGGFRSAEQALLAIDALSLSSKKKEEGGANSPVVRREIKKLYDLLDVKDPARYEAASFSKGLESLRRVLTASRLTQ